MTQQDTASNDEVRLMNMIHGINPLPPGLLARQEAKEKREREIAKQEYKLKRKRLFA